MMAMAWFPIHDSSDANWAMHGGRYQQLTAFALRGVWH